jgi:hypothetical protein
MLMAWFIGHSIGNCCVSKWAASSVIYVCELKALLHHCGAYGILLTSEYCTSCDVLCEIMGNARSTARLLCHF